MEHRRFYVALGVPRDAQAQTIQVAYRKMVTRYRRALTSHAFEDDPTEPPPAFRVMRTYSERRHRALMDLPEPLDASQSCEVDRLFQGHVPDVDPAARQGQAQASGKDLFVELRLSHAEARNGGLFPVHIPVLRPCPACSDGGSEHLVCHLCHGTGRVTEDKVVEVTAPPGVHDGQVARMAMDDVGLEETEMVVVVVVS